MNLDTRQITRLELFREEVAFLNRQLVKVEPSRKRDELEADLHKAQHLIELLMPRSRWQAKRQQAQLSATEATTWADPTGS